VARINGAALGTTTPIVRGDLLVANATPALARLAKGSTGQVLSATATDAIWQALTQSQFPTAPNGLLTANLNDSQVTTAKLAPGAAFYWIGFLVAGGGLTFAGTEILLVDVDASGATTNRPILVIGVCPVTVNNTTASASYAQFTVNLKSGGAAGQAAGSLLQAAITNIGAPGSLVSGGLTVIPYVYTPTAAVGRLKLTVSGTYTGGAVTFATNYNPMIAAVQWS
jgi:hypothetical protein